MRVISLKFRMRAARRAFSLVDLLAAITILTSLLGLMGPMVLRAREESRVGECRDRLRQLGKAFLDFESAKSGLAPRRVGFSEAAAYGGWGSEILPFVDAKLGDKYQKEYDFWDPVNREVVETTIPTFVCPDAPEDRKVSIKARASARSRNPNRDEEYTVHCGPNDFIASNGLFIPNKGYGATWPRTARGNDHQALNDNTIQPLRNITDGTSTTFLIVERAGLPNSWLVGKKVDEKAPFDLANNSRGAWAGWGSIALGVWDRKDGKSQPQGTSEDCAVNCTNFLGIYAFHPDGANVLMCDGSVHFVGTRLDGLTLARLNTRDDGQLISVDDFAVETTSESK